jgi:hypothetical protein
VLTEKQSNDNKIAVEMREKTNISEEQEDFDEVFWDYCAASETSLIV